MPTSKDFTYTLALFNLFRNVRITVIFVDEKLHADGRGVNTRVAVAFARWNFLLFLSTKTIKNSTGQMRQLKRVCSHWIPPMIGWRRDKNTNLHMALGFSVLYTCSIENNAFSVLHYVIKVTLHYLMLHRLEIHSSLELSRSAFSGCRLAASRLRSAACWQLLTIN